MIAAELRVVIRRLSGRATLLLGAGVGVLSVVLMALVQNLGGDGGMQFNGTPIDQLVTLSGPDAARWALAMRNFFVLPLLLLLATGAALAGEIKDHTLRERLVQPVSRGAVFRAKLAALVALSAASLVCTGVLSLGLGVLFFGTGVGGMELLGAYLLSALVDVGLIGLGMMLGTVVGSAGGVVVAGVLLMGTDWAIRAGLAVLAMLGMAGASHASDWMPGTGWGLHTAQGFAEMGYPALNLLIWSGIFFGLAWSRFSRMDLV